MPTAVVYIGDSLVTLTSHQSLDRDDPLPFHYTAHFRDVATGECAELSFSGENDMMMTLAAWLVADEFNIGMLEPYRARLQAELPKGFMP